MNPLVVLLKVSSFRGISIGAKHYYGELDICDATKLGVPTPSGGRMYGYGCPPLTPNVDLTYKLTASQAAALTVHDGELFGWKEGMETGRYDTKEDVYAAAIAWVQEQPNKDDIFLTAWKMIHPYNSVRDKILHASEEIRAVLKPLQDREKDRLIHKWVYEIDNK